MSAHWTLVAVRALIEPADQWTQGALARDAEGRGAHPGSFLARSWCALGAINRVAGSDYLEAETALAEACRGEIQVVNDVEGHSAILEALDRAIEATAPAGAPVGAP